MAGGGWQKGLSTFYLLPSTFYFYAAWRRVLLRRVVEHEHPVQHLALVGRRERVFAGVRERADDGRRSVAWVEPPRGDPGAGDRAHANAERPADRGIDHGI